MQNLDLMTLCLKCIVDNLLPQMQDHRPWGLLTSCLANLVWMLLLGVYSNAWRVLTLGNIHSEVGGPCLPWESVVLSTYIQ